MKKIIILNQENKLKDSESGQILNWRDLYCEAEINDAFPEFFYNVEFIMDSNQNLIEKEDVGALLEFFLYAYTFRNKLKNRLKLFISCENSDSKLVLKIQNKLVNLFSFFLESMKVELIINEKRVVNYEKFQVPVQYFPALPINAVNYNILFIKRFKDVEDIEKLFNRGLYYNEEDIEEYILLDFYKDWNQKIDSQMYPQLTSMFQYCQRKVTEDGTLFEFLNIMIEEYQGKHIESELTRFLENHRIVFVNDSKHTKLSRRVMLGKLFNSVSNGKISVIYNTSFFMKTEQDLERMYVLLILKLFSLSESKYVGDFRQLTSGFYDEFLKNQNVFTVLLTAAFWYHTGHTKSQWKNKNNDLKKLFAQAKVYALGAKEIAENIIKHTNSKEGILYFRLHKKTAVDLHALSSEQYDGDSSWLELSVLDSGKFGMLETCQGKYTNIEDLFERLDLKIQLSDMMDWQKIQDVIYYKGLGIMQQHVKNTGGFFQVHTTNGNNTLFFKSDGRVNCEQGSSIGTSYRIFFPVSCLNENVYLEKYLEIEGKEEKYKSFNSNWQETVSFTEKWMRQLYSNYSINLKDEIKSEKNPPIKSRKIVEAWVEELGKPFIEDNKTEYLYIDANENNVDIKALFYLVLLGKLKKLPYQVIYNVLPEVIDEYKNDYMSIVASLTLPNGEGLPSDTQLFLFSPEGELYRTTNQNSIWAEVNEQRALLEAMSGENGTFNAPIIEKHIKNLLTIDLKNRKEFGLCHEGHISLGKKIHIDRFYQAELMFGNSYYNTCFSLVLAKTLMASENIILVGYRSYSLEIITKVKEILGEKVVRTCIYEGDAQRLLLEEQDITSDSRLVILVPVASTLKTFNKVYSKIFHFARIENWSTEKQELLNKIPKEYYTFLLSRDARHKKGELSELERKYGWSDIYEKDKRIVIDGDLPYKDKKEINYFLLTEASWYKAIECDLCQKNDEILLSTTEASLTLDTKLGLPYNEHLLQAYVNEEGIEDVYTKILSEFVIGGHLERNYHHFQFYVDTLSFFKHLLLQHKETLKKWKNKMREDFSNDEGKVIIIAQKHFSNVGFIEWINREVFDNNAIVIKEDFKDEFYSDFACKYGFIREERSAKFVFCDDSLVTGRTFSKVHSLLHFIKHTNSKVDISVIVLINRMDYNNRINTMKKMQRYHAFMDINIPIIKEQAGDCWLCQEKETLQNLSCAISSSVMHRYFRNQANKLDIFSIKNMNDVDEKKKDNSEFVSERFLLTNMIYCKLFAINVKEKRFTDEDIKRELGIAHNGEIEKNIMGGEITYRYKASFLKVLTLPFLEYFYNIAKLGLKICVVELEKVSSLDYNKFSPQQSGEVCDYINILVKQLSRLNSDVIFVSATIKNIWNSYYRFLKIYKKEESKISKRDKFYIYYSRAVLERIFDDDTRNLQLIRTLKNWSVENLEDEKAKTDFRFFKESVLLTSDPILHNAYNSYLLDREIAQESELEEMVAKNYYYDLYRELLSECDIEESSYSNVLRAIYQIKRKAGNPSAEFMFSSYENMAIAILEENDSLKAVYEDVSIYYFNILLENRVYITASDQLLAEKEISNKAEDDYESLLKAHVKKHNNRNGSYCLDWIEHVWDDLICFDGNNIHMLLPFIAEKKGCLLSFELKEPVCEYRSYLLYKCFRFVQNELIEELEYHKQKRLNDTELVRPEKVITPAHR